LGRSALATPSAARLLHVKIRRIDFSPDEWIAGTVNLSDRERGIYWQLCALIYSHGGPVLESDLRQVCSSRSRDYQQAIDHLLSLHKITKDGPYLSQKRAIAELERSQERARRSTENGHKGGRPSNKINDVENPGLSGVSRARAHHQPSTINHTDKEPDGSLSGKQEPAHVGSNGRGTRLSEAWRPSAEDVAFAVGLGLDAGAIADEFADYWRAVPGGKGIKLDWDATWRNWCRRAHPATGNGDARSRGGRPGVGSIAAALSRVHLPHDRENVE
jgi:uncharacterized protein YdaU (DUF1376 family)